MNNQSAIPSRRAVIQFRWTFVLALLAITFTLGGCSTFKGMFNKVTVGDDEEVVQNMPPEARIKEGMDSYDVGDYTVAIKSFKTLLDEHPFTPQAMLAQLKLADSYYYDGQYEEAKTRYKEFEDRHPANEAASYVLFQEGMCDFARTSRIDRDPDSMLQAINSFNRLLNAYPNSAYTDEAKKKIVEARDYLANHEYMVAVFYVRTAQEQGAKQRLHYLLNTYPESSLAPKAKELLAELETGKMPSTGLRSWLPRFMTDDPEKRQESSDAPDSDAPEAGEQPNKED